MDKEMKHVKRVSLTLMTARIIFDCPAWTATVLIVVVEGKLSEKSDEECVELSSLSDIVCQWKEAKAESQKVVAKAMGKGMVGLWANSRRRSLTVFSTSKRKETSSAFLAGGVWGRF